ncbi:hypothetical protein AYO20_09192 [Fonsecaea nubica]|uniref:Cyclase n=1 Tax=Fonsecaea nubica TaxID=856822 RepID=A0A178CK95_9EURO|nr:hypothetical protein AYO20_09192 [Fonsecaea nubica]OAL29455.1 hypothetical protein AYO20_09192 [Fonsecaea nubica]
MPPFDPDSDHLPKLADLEQIPGAPKYAAWFWGENDETTREQIVNSSRIGLQAWGKQGIAGRAILLDIYSFTKKSYDPLSARRITLEELRACAEVEGVEFKYGDILLVRTGWSAGYNQLDAAGRQAYQTKGFHELAFAGVDCGEEVVEFLHDHYFSAVASDSPTFESWPPSVKPGQEILHSFLLPLWGVPIGEMWDLDGLAELCKKTRRWEFFLTSCPANVKGGVGSHPNAIALF